MPEQNLLDFTGIRYYDQWFKAHFPDKFATRADLEEVAALAAAAYRFLGKVPSKDALPEDAAIGDVYAVGETGDQYAWTGEAWDKVTLDLHLENYVKIGDWTPPGGAMSPEDKTKLSGVAMWATNTAVDVELNDAVDGDEGALAGSSVTIFVSNGAGDAVAVGPATEYSGQGTSSSTVSFWIPISSVPDGGVISVEDAIKPRLVAEGAPVVVTASLADSSGAMEFNPGAGASKRTNGLLLNVEWDPASGRADGPTDAFGTFDVSWSTVASRGMHRLSIIWHHPSERAACSILVKRDGGLPIGLNQGIHRPGVGRSVMVQTGAASKVLSLDGMVIPVENSPLSSGRLDQSAPGMTSFDCSALDPLVPLPSGTPQRAPYKQFRGVGVVEQVWKDGGQHGSIGDFRLVWQRVEDGTYIATLYWDLPGALKGRTGTFSLGRLDESTGDYVFPTKVDEQGHTVVSAASGPMWAYAPVRKSLVVPVSASQMLGLSTVEITAADGLPLPEGMARAYLNPNAEAMDFDGSVLTKAGEYQYLSGVRLVWEDAAGAVHGPTDEYGIFSVCWTLAAINKASDADDAPVVSRTYTADVAWCPNVLRAYHVLANYVAKQELDDRLSGADADCATAQKNGTMSGPDKEKLDGIEAGANNYVLPRATDELLGGVYVDTIIKNSENPVQNAAVFEALAGKIGREGVADATHPGLLSAAGKEKLDSVEEGANNYVLPQATDALLGGVYVDANLDGASTNPVQNTAVYSGFSGKIGRDALADATHPGLLSAAGKEKLDSIEEDANNYVLPQATDVLLGGVYVDACLDGASTNPVQNAAVHSGFASKLGWGDADALADTTRGGLLSAEGKAKLNGVEAGANRIVVDDALDSASTNPVQNAVIALEITSIGGGDQTPAGFLDDKLLNKAEGGAAIAQTVSGTKTFDAAIDGSVTGSAGTTDRLLTARTISLDGDADGTVPFDGSEDVVINVRIPRLVPSCKPEEFDMPLGVNDDGSVTWAPDSSNGFLLRAGDQTVRTEKIFNTVASSATPPQVPDPADGGSAVPVFYIADAFRAQVEKATGGENTVVYDALGNPHVMVVLPRFNIEDVIDLPGITGPHMAFDLGSGAIKSEILIGKYLTSFAQATSSTTNIPGLCTLPGRAPLTYPVLSLSPMYNASVALGQNFDCENVYTRAARALWVTKQRGSNQDYCGNTNRGRDCLHPAQYGKVAAGLTNSIMYCGLTTGGSGPVEWNDTATENGVCDFVGNAFEYVKGLYFYNGCPKSADHASIWRAASMGNWSLVYIGADGPGNGSLTIDDAIGFSVVDTKLVASVGGRMTGSNIVASFQDVELDPSLQIGVGVKMLVHMGLIPGTTLAKGTWRLDQSATEVYSKSHNMVGAGACWNDGFSGGPFSLTCNLDAGYSLNSLFRPPTLGMRIVYIP